MFHYVDRKVHGAIEGNERAAASEVASSTSEPRGMLLSYNVISIRNFTVKQIRSVQRRAQIALMGLNLSRIGVKDVPSHGGRQ
jgi:hypothetical protein